MRGRCNDLTVREAQSLEASAELETIHIENTDLQHFLCCAFKHQPWANPAVHSGSLGGSGFRSGLTGYRSAGWGADSRSQLKAITCYTELGSSGPLHGQHRTAGVTTAVVEPELRGPQGRGEGGCAQLWGT